ncbi:MAG: homoserine dehydrogenase [Fulvivirga sp.]
MKKYNIGLFGFGCVGQGFSELLSSNKHLNAQIVKTCVKQLDKPRVNLPGKLVADPDEILNDQNIDIVVELIDDADVAFKIVSNALKEGRKVITANKKMVAQNLSQLIDLEKAYGGKMLYEGAVCGSIPILTTLRNYHTNDQILTLSGILNGSTNYILTKVIEQNLSYEEALLDAKGNGFAESDPSLDVLAYDPSFKLSILIHQAFGVIIPPDKVYKKGITDISQADITFAKQHGLKIKLIAEARLVDGDIQAWVCPKFIDETDPFYLVNDEYNVVKIESAAAGDQLLFGKGAGKLPTGLAVLADLSTLLKTEIDQVVCQTSNVELSDNYAVEVYISYKSDLAIDLSCFELISEKSHGKVYSYAIGKITVDKLKIFQEKFSDVSIIFTSDTRQELNIKSLTYQSNAIAVGTI